MSGVSETGSEVNETSLDTIIEIGLHDVILSKLLRLDYTGEYI
jgi:hypothetical protein